MVLQLPRVVSMKLHRVGKQLRHVTQSWMGRTGPKPAGSAKLKDESPHSYSHVHNTGEMNHLGQYMCDVCGTEMRAVKTAAPRLVIVEGAEEPEPVAWDFRWECPQCRQLDRTSFRTCTKCGRQAVPDRYAGSARNLPVALNAGGCTECEKCILCDGILAIGNLKWFYGHWSHNYPVTEYDRKSEQHYTVTRERSKYYGFHCHFSCFEKNPRAIDQIIDSRAPDWYKQGLAEQKREEEAQLRQENRCLTCKLPLGFWDRLVNRERHEGCSAQNTRSTSP
ncbi:MAG: hypothetical protein M3Y13_12480 [Armatimonadota bacterium]|nr:hypothetical protein [Armatimonadota bacterium]